MNPDVRTRTSSRRITLTVRLPLAVWATVMVVVSSLPGRSIPRVSLRQWDKLAHLFEYAVLAALASRYLRAVRKTAPAVSFRLALIASMVFAVLDELHQILIPDRTCAWQDLVADAAGIVIGLLVLRAIPRSWEKM